MTFLTQHLGLSIFDPVETTQHFLECR